MGFDEQTILSDELCIFGNVDEIYGISIQIKYVYRVQNMAGNSILLLKCFLG